ncbi:hypothetical protein K8354_13790 [Polaribacter litorisediminis]|uniref:hypothetical protein n=1 Tax=Polaribacter litorisediminis TaxID=1908341 RepID=UPI001CBC7C85|nr:hypothetical protein [Polaribacter litorisediminis]UAM97382.1 hypothetical protein K8354_13790 [Polaribacter litorisediminis]
MKNLKFLFLFATILGLTFTSCSSDPDPIITVDSQVIENLKNGIMNGALDENYTLDASITYTLSGSFLIQDDVTLNVPAGTQINAVAGGVDTYIAVLQGGKINVNGTIGSPVIMSSTNSAPGDWGGLTLCGKATTTAGANASAEVGGFVYGGSTDNDSSGIIRNLIIRGTGAAINAESEYNGVSFYAVGSGTVVENLAVIDGADDGVEFFGGTVSVTNLYLENNEDDSIDWTEGWNGTVTNSYIVNTKANFSTVVEADKENGNPKLINLTAVSSVGGTALQFKKQSGATITGLSLVGYDVTVDMADDGPLANIIIDGATADPALSYNAPATVDVALFSWASAELTEVVDLSGTLSTSLTLDSSKKYRLSSSFIVEANGKLTIPAGTKISARSGGVDVYLAVLIDGEIDIQGTTSNPVVMSSTNGEPGDWGGLTICGKATTTSGANSTAEVGGFVYGGTTDDDSSGSIKNLVIKGTGAAINSESEYNGISFYAVGSGTIIENIAVINGADDGVEFYGGAVSVTNLYLENNEDDSVDWTEGWSGTVTNTYISHTIPNFSTAFEADKENANPIFTNVTAISTTGGIALQFKKQSGATITNLYLSGYDTNIDMADDGPLANVIIDGAAAVLTGTYNSGSQVDISSWTWIEAEL